MKINSKNLNTSLCTKKFFIFLMALGMFVLFISPEPVEGNSRKLDKEEIKQKINELKQQEQVEVRRLTNVQINLQKTQQSIKSHENELRNSRINLSRLQSRLNALEKEHGKLAQTAEKRIREIYKGERMGLLHIIFSSQDIPTFLDRLYYQDEMIRKDREIMDNLKQKSEEIIRSQRTINYEQRNIASSLESMNRKKQNLDNSKQTSEYLINRLRTDRQAYEQAQAELESLSKDIEKDLAKNISRETILDSTFLRPIAGVITSGYGWRRHPIHGSTRFHSGIDIAGQNRAPIKASNAGKVVHSGWYGGYGIVVIVDHGILTEGRYAGQKISTLYAHMHRTAVNVGNYVKKGQVVGYEGSTGYSTGPHLHFEIRVDGKTANPLEFINR